MRLVRDQGRFKADRTGTGTTSVFGHQMRFDLSEGFPLVTTKKVHLKSIILELLWFLRGDSNVQWLQERGVHDLGRMGARGRRPRARSTACSGAPGRRPTAATSTRSPRSSSSSRPTPTRAASSSAPGTWPTCRKMALMPCHAFFQFYVAPPEAPGGRGKLSCQLYQRSADIFLGVPFNIASYALLTHMLAQQCDLDVGDFIWTGGDCHLYANHAEQVDDAARSARPSPTRRCTSSAGRRRSSTTSTRTSRCSTTSTTRRSRPRWPYEGRADRGGGAQRRHRARQRAAVEAAARTWRSSSAPRSATR